MKKLHLGSFARAGIEIDSFASVLISFFFCIRIIKENNLDLAQSKSLFKKIASTTHTKLDLKLITQNVIEKIKAKEIVSCSGEFMGVEIEADENTTANSIKVIYGHVDLYRRKP